MANDLAQLEEWFGQIIAGLAPSERRKATARLGRELRKANLARIAANVEPDGSAMEPKKARYDKRGRLRQAAGAKMFKGLRYAKHWRIDSDADGVEIKPASPIAGHNAASNHFGETVTVGRLRNGQRIRVRYAERLLLGFSDADEKLPLDIAADLLDRSA